jgi:ParB family chromosome partitioning protein
MRGDDDTIPGLSGRGARRSIVSERVLAEHLADNSDMPPRRKKKAEKGSRGLTPAETLSGSPPRELEGLRHQIEADGGVVLGSFRDPLGGHWQVLASLAIDKVEPTPFQRDLSDTHVKRLAGVIDTLGRFLDPIIAVHSDKGVYWTPNGYHRLSAMKRLGAKSIVALVLPERELAYKILALNTEKAHNLREKSLEVIRMARDLATLDKRAEKDYALEFEEASFLTLGVCYEKNGRFAGGAYHPLLKRIDEFSAEPLDRALSMREGRAERVMELEEAVAKAMQALKEKGFESPYLRAFVVARINPLRFHKGEKPSFDATLEKMIASAKKFNVASIRAEQLARAGGAPDE